MKKSALRDQIKAIFLAKPQDIHNVATLLKLLPGESEPNIRYHVGKLSHKDGVERAFIIKDPRVRGYYKLNPAYKSIEMMRSEVTAHLVNNARVEQSERPFSPLEPPITSFDRTDRLFLASIIQRMRKSELFTAADIELLRLKLPGLIEAEQK